MKAIVIKKPGGPENLIVAEVPPPNVGEQELLVKVKAIGVNRADILQRKGLYPSPPGASQLMGLEMAGIITKCGTKCTRWQTNERIFAVVPGGAYAEYVVVHQNLAMPIPLNLGYLEAAGIGEVFLTAYQALFWLGELKRNDTVLIHAGASGVGTAAIQLARNAGANIIVTASSPAKLKRCHDLGATHGINYQADNFAIRVQELTDNRGVNLIIDVSGAGYFKQNLNSAAIDGRIVILALMGGRNVDQVDLSPILLNRIKIVGSTLRNRNLDYRTKLTAEFTRNCLPLFKIGQLQPIIDRVQPWEEVTEAHRYMESNQNIGKIILELPD